MLSEAASMENGDDRNAAYAKMEQKIADEKCLAVRFPISRTCQAMYLMYRTSSHIRQEMFS